MTEYLGQPDPDATVKTGVPHSGDSRREVRELPVIDYNTPLGNAPVDSLALDPGALLDGDDPDRKHLRKVQKQAQKQHGSRVKLGLLAGSAAGIAAVVVGGVVVAGAGGDSPDRAKDPVATAPTNPGNTAPTTGEITPTTPENELPGFTLDKASTPFLLTDSYTDLTTPNEIRQWMTEMSSPMSADYLDVFTDKNAALIGYLRDNTDPSGNAAAILNQISNPSTPSPEDLGAQLEDDRERLSFLGGFYSSAQHLAISAQDRELLGTVPAGTWGDYDTAKETGDETTLLENAIMPDDAYLHMVSSTLVYRAMTSGDYSPEQMNDLMNAMAGFGALNSPAGDYDKTVKSLFKTFSKWQHQYDDGKEIDFADYPNETLKTYNTNATIEQGRIVGTLYQDTDIESTDAAIGSDMVAVVLRKANGGVYVQLMRETPAPVKNADDKGAMILWPTTFPDERLVATQLPDLDKF